MKEPDAGRKDGDNAVGYLRANIEAMKGYTPGEQPESAAGVIKLNTNENPYPPSPAAIKAAREALKLASLYPSPMSDDLRSAAAEAYGFEPARILAGNGCDDILAMAIRSFVPPGGAAACPVPTYSLYETLAEIAGVRLIRIPFGEDYSLPDGLARADARLILLANPNSPTGTAVPPQDVRRLAESFPGVVLVDEAYVDFAEQNCMELARQLPNVIVTRSFSKSFSLAGLRIGLAFADAALIAGMTKVKDSYNLDRVAQAAAAAALRDIRHMKRNVERIRKTRAFLSEGLRKAGFDVLPSQSNFVFARPRGIEAKALYLELRRRSILIRHFDSEPVRDSVRITVGTDRQVKTLLRAIAEIMEETGR